MHVTIKDVQALIHATLMGTGEEFLNGVNALDCARQGEITFAEHDRFAEAVRVSPASAIIVSMHFPEMAEKNLLRVADPREAFIQVMIAYGASPAVPKGIHPSAVVASTAVLGAGVAVGECAVIRDQVRIGRETVIDAGAVIGEDVVIGEQCRIGPNVSIMHGSRIGSRVIMHAGTVIGADGFGYVWRDNRHLKVPQLGNVLIEDDVELGANVCVDRATFGSTIIRRGTKVDNLVQIAHNNVIGQHVIIPGQVGLSGSVTVGDRVMFGGQAGVSDHVTIGQDARVGIGTLVIKDVAPGESVFGVPARASRRAKRELAGLTRLPELLKDVRRLEARIADLESRFAPPFHRAMTRVVTRLAASVACLAILAAAAPSGWAASAKEINAGVEATLKRFYQDVSDGKALAREAKGVLVFPGVFKAGLGIGGEYGEGALRIKGKTAGYYSTAAASIGLQLGAQKKSIVILFMKDDALKRFRDSAGWKVGADASVALVAVGAGGTVDSAKLQEPILGFVFGQKGLMYNLTLEGAKITKIQRD